jgi:hypothetical protein
VETGRAATDSVTLCPFTSDPTDAPLFRLLIEPDQGNGLETPSRIMVDNVTSELTGQGEALGVPASVAAAAASAPLSVLLTLGLDFLHNGSVAGTGQHPAQIDNRLGVDVLIRGHLEEFGLRPDSNGNHAIAVRHDRADRLQQRDHGMPFDVVAHGMLEDLAQRVAVMVVEVHRL